MLLLISTVVMDFLLKIMKGSPSALGVGQMDPKTIPEASHGISQTPCGQMSRGGAKGTAERKTRRVSGKATGKENAKKGNVKKTTPLRQSEKGDKLSCSVSMSISGTGQLVKFEGLKTYEKVDYHGSATIPCGVVSIPTSNLLDLNTLAPPSSLFQHPFTDLQQVQLQAQIFVYGSLM